MRTGLTTTESLQYDAGDDRLACATLFSEKSPPVISAGDKVTRLLVLPLSCCLHSLLKETLEAAQSEVTEHKDGILFPSKCTASL